MIRRILLRLLRSLRTSGLRPEGHQQEKGPTDLPRTRLSVTGCGRRSGAAKFRAAWSAATRNSTALERRKRPAGRCRRAPSRAPVSRRVRLRRPLPAGGEGRWPVPDECLQRCRPFEWIGLISGTMRISSPTAPDHRRGPSAMSTARSDCDRAPDSQNLRRISRLWIKLEQVSQVSRKSLTALAKIALQTC